MGDAVAGENMLGFDSVNAQAGNPPNSGEIKPKLLKKRATGLPRMGKPKLPVDRRRVFVSVRVLPKTKALLLSLNERNLGHALDKLAVLAEDAGLLKIPTTFI